jgi:MFS family permease
MPAQRRTVFAVGLIVIAEAFGTSLWFSVNAVAESLQQGWGLDTGDIGHLTSAVQAGFIAGTFVFAISGLADRFSASRVFAACAVVGALSNAAFAGLQDWPTAALLMRFVTGLALAGIYPIGMKLVMSWAPERAGQMLGWLVGMLALGSGLPHLIRGSSLQFDWQLVLYCASLLALIGGAAVAWQGDGPHHGQRSRMRWGAILSAFGHRDFRAVAFAYFGHMWELYAFWAAAPFLIVASGLAFGNAASLTTFAVFAGGALGCIVGGLISRRWGNARVALAALAGSAAMCLIYPMLGDAPTMLSLAVLLAWGVFVVADSPQFSALAAAACDKRDVGAALAMMNSIGFAISIVSIELALAWLSDIGPRVGWLLLPGPVIGLWVLRKGWRTGPAS